MNFKWRAVLNCVHNVDLLWMINVSDFSYFQLHWLSTKIRQIPLKMKISADIEQAFFIKDTADAMCEVLYF